ncbi:MAG: twin-arginine translocase subunit TatC [Gemmatimonadetes bacterium]|nr:twin-arginine translocase subunit TatC [Gemmatimonadota bacterium]
MPFLDHLEELRWRLVKAVGALAVGFGAAFWFAWTHDVITPLVYPVRKLLPEGALMYTHPMGKFTILMQVAGVIGVMLASPVIAYQVWAFLSPAMHPRERRVIVPVLGFAAALFIAGVALAWFLFVPVTIDMMEGVKTDALKPLITAESYFGFMIFTCLAFGAVFELPILSLVLTALGILTPAALAGARRWAAAISLVVCMIITPGDFVLTTLMLWIPVYGLYELSIVVSWVVDRAKRRRAAAAA